MCVAVTDVMKNVFRLLRDDSSGCTKFWFAKCGRKHLRDTLNIGLGLRPVVGG